MPKVGVIHRQVVPITCCRDLGCAVLMLMVLTIVGCATSATPDRVPAPHAHGGQPTEPMLRAEIRSWLGTPHRMGGMSPRGIDCSGLVVTLYKDLFDMPLPRTTRALMRTGRQVDRGRLVAGDLVFFKPAAKYDHVGIYLGHGEFVHTSSRYGVMVSLIEDDFWRRCYLTGRRVL